MLAIWGWAAAVPSPLLAQSPDSAPASAAQMTFTERDINQAIDENQALLRKYPDQDFTPLVMFQLCELHVRRSTIDYQKAMAEYDAALKRFEAGEAQAEPAAPRIDFSAAIDLADQILVKYPTATFLDKVLYRLALCHSEAGNQETARAYLERLVNEHPRSAYLLESYFRLGENYFDKRQYDLAIAAYSKLFNKWDNPYFDMALYKLGWSYYNLNDYAKAISTFIYLIDDINNVSALQAAEALGKTKIDLRKEAVEYVAVCFAEFGGAKKAETFLTESLNALAPGKVERRPRSASIASISGAASASLPSSGNEAEPASKTNTGNGAEHEYVVDIFLKLADTYRSRNAYDESTTALEILLRRWPLHLQAPQLQNKIVENYLLTKNPEKAEAARVAQVKNYGPGSAWLTHYLQNSNIDGAVEARLAALTLADDALLTLASEAQKRGQKTNAADDYRLAIERYGEYLEKFSNSPACAKVQYLQAECFYEIKAFAEAGAAYHKLAANYPQSELAVEAAYNRVLAHLEEIDQTTKVDSLTYQIADFLGSGVTQILRLPNQAYAKFLNACSDFSKLPAAGDRLPQVLMKYGETLYKLGQFELSRQVYVKVAAELPPNNFSLQAVSMVAQSAFQTGDYQESEKWYRKIISDFPDSTRQVERAQKMIASATFKVAEEIAESLKATGDGAIAAQAFVRLADSSSDEEISKRSFLEAATLYESNGDKAKALGVYEQLYAKFPNADGADLALLKAGQLAEALNEWRHAAQNYLRLANAFPVSSQAPRAVFQAGACFENAGDTLNAVSAYRRYAQTYKDDPTQRLEVMVKLGELYFHRGQLTDAKMSLQEAITAYRRFQEEQTTVDEYIPAQAQFLLAEMRFQAYRKIELTPPVDRNFQKKQKLFNEVLAAYRDAADYQVAEWATAASHKIGETFEEFARAFAEAPRPGGLSDADLELYQESLKQKIRPFKERALETYRANVRLADENNVQNAWVESSRKRAEVLASELGVPGLGEAAPAAANGSLESTN